MIRSATFVLLLLIAAAVSSAIAENAGGYDAAALVVTSPRGDWHGFVRYAPKPNIARSAVRQHLPAHGVYVVDIGAGGSVDDVRILRSSGDEVIDDAVLAALRQWIFIRHTIYKATVAFEFGVAPRSRSR